MAKYHYHRLDANHRAIREGLERIGASVSTHGPLDLLVGFRGKTFVLEIKTARGKLRPSQVQFIATWKGHCATVRTLEEALSAIGVIILAPPL